MMRKDTVLECPKCSSLNVKTEIDEWGQYVATCTRCHNRGILVGEATRQFEGY